MIEVAGKLREIQVSQPGEMPLAELLAHGEPAVLRGIAREWTLVRKGLESAEAARGYITSFYNGRPIDFSYAGPEARGRAFYKDDFSALNFTVRRDRLDP